MDVCPYLSPECGDRGLNNEGCAFAGRSKCMSSCEFCNDTGIAEVSPDMDGVTRVYECTRCKK